LAFQIADDLLDREGDATRLGKATRKDAGKATILSVAGVARARQWLDALEAEMAAALATFGLRAEGLRQAAHFVVSRTA
jgi:farnesyl diphosphate synthase